MKFTLRTQAAAAMLVLAPLGAALVAQPAAAQVYTARVAHSDQGRINNLSLNSDGGLRPGATLRVQVYGTPGARWATVALGDDVGAAMREKSFGFLALLTRLRQTCCDPDMLPWLKSPLADSGKISLLMEKLTEIVSSGHKVVIFSQFVMLLDRVREALARNFPELPRYELTGMTLDRLKPVQSFQQAPGAAAMLVSLKAAGTGITLHAADYVFLLDPWWNPAVEAQAVDRVHRIGQTNTVFVYRMVTAGTIEERIQALKASKKDLFDKLIGGLGGDFDLSQHFTSLKSLVALTATTPVEDEEIQEPYTID